MKTKQFLTLAAVAMGLLLTAGCAGPYYGGAYSGPYYGSYGPYEDDNVFIWGGNRSGYSGGHHFYGNGFAHGAGSHGSFHGGSSSGVSHGGGGGHGERH